MAAVRLSLMLLVLSSTSYAIIPRIRRDLSRIDSNQQIFYQALPSDYGPPSLNQESKLQESNYFLLNHIQSELNLIESLVQRLLSHYNAVNHNTGGTKSLPSHYGPPAPDSSLYTGKSVHENIQTIQSSISNLKSIAQQLRSELDKHAKVASRIDKTPVINPDQHYHINAAGVLPEFLTLDPFVAYGPAPNVNFAPPAPGATSDNVVSLTDIYSPPDGVLLAPPAPGQFPIRTSQFPAIRTQ